MTRALLLNASYEPQAVISDRKMVMHYMGGVVEPVEFSDRVFRSVHLTIMVPSVARLITYVKMPAHHKSVLLTTRAVLARDNYTCGYCGRTNLTTGNKGNGTMDHIVPRALNGPHTWSNVTASCKKCNLKKSHHRLEDLGWVLNRKPTVPRGIAAYVLSLNPEPEWMPYLQVA